MASRDFQPGAHGRLAEGQQGRDRADRRRLLNANFAWLRGGESGVETAEQRIETSMRILFDLDGSRDASRDAARVLRMARKGESRAAILEQFMKVQSRLRERADYETCGRLADVVLEMTASPGGTEGG